jgi:hypothetical protein
MYCKKCQGLPEDSEDEHQNMSELKVITLQKECINWRLIKCNIYSLFVSSQ